MKEMNEINIYPIPYSKELRQFPFQQEEDF